jgi:hypothetical protein
MEARAFGFLPLAGEGLGLGLEGGLRELIRVEREKRVDDVEPVDGFDEK